MSGTGWGAGLADGLQSGVAMWSQLDRDKRENEQWALEKSKREDEKRQRDIARQIDEHGAKVYRDLMNQGKDAGTTGQPATPTTPAIPNAGLDAPNNDVAQAYPVRDTAADVTAVSSPGLDSVKPATPATAPQNTQVAAPSSPNKPGLDTVSSPDVTTPAAAPAITQTSPATPQVSRKSPEEIRLAVLDARAEKAAELGDMDAWHKNSSTAIAYKDDLRKRAYAQALPAYEAGDVRPMQDFYNKYVNDGHNVTDFKKNPDGTYTLTKHADDGSELPAMTINKDQLDKYVAMGADPNMFREMDAQKYQAMWKSKIDTDAKIRESDATGKTAENKSAAGLHDAQADYYRGAKSELDRAKAAKAEGATGTGGLSRQDANTIFAEAQKVVTTTDPMGKTTVDAERLAPINAVAQRLYASGQAGSHGEAVMLAQQQLKDAEFTPKRAQERAQAELDQIKKDQNVTGALNPTGNSWSSVAKKLTGKDVSEEQFVKDLAAAYLSNGKRAIGGSASTAPAGGMREGATGTAADGTRVIVRNGQIVPLDQAAPAGLSSVPAKPAGQPAPAPTAAPTQAKSSGGLSSDPLAGLGTQGARDMRDRLSKELAKWQGSGDPNAASRITELKNLIDRIDRRDY